MLRTVEVADGVRLRVRGGGAGPFAATGDDLEALYGDVLSIWQPWASDRSGLAIPSGHHKAEDAPDDLAAALADLLRRPAEAHRERSPVTPWSGRGTSPESVCRRERHRYFHPV